MWRDIPGYEGLYQASSHGSIRSLTITTTRSMRVRGGATKVVTQTRAGRTLKAGIGKLGYPRVVLCKDGKRFETYVHHLVALTFIGPRPTGMHICHQDGDPLNASATNLRYDSPKGNAGDRDAHGTGAKGIKNPMAKLNESKVRAIRDDIRAGALNLRQIGDKHGCSRQAVNDIKQKRRWAHVL